MTNEQEEDRRNQIDDIVAEMFGDQGGAEERLDGFRSVRQEMIEIVRAHPNGCVCRELFEDEEFKQVVFPERLRPLLRVNDVFLASLGLRDGDWIILELSPLYESDDVIYDLGEDDGELPHVH